MTSALTRRSFVSAAPAAIVAASVPALASARPDAELLRLGEALSAAWTRQAAAEAELNATYPLENEDVRWEAFDAAYHEASAIVDRIEALPATTLAGLIVKARACNWCHDGEQVEANFFFPDGKPTTDMRLGASILGDLLAMGGANA